ncbi:hypothetical protein Gogos_000715 [Gossypium gossypioides]|uniref:CCHC-type domain-containing protein n=1 Tax=Gossypium gossypioides TaxID=34282 RepID=A0A7J9CUA4_GOSGO|nr:hypothetical protein [Gossypium gossypioides]
MADLWHRIGGIFILDLGEKRYLFQFFYEMEKNRVLKGIPSFFNNHLLLMHKNQPRENPLLVPLLSDEFWVQVHDLPPGLMSATMAHQFGSFLGTFLEYDAIIPTRGVQIFMRIKVWLDVSLPLKRRKKIMVGKDHVFYARIQYEKLSLFCFMCGKLGHGESFCPIRVWIDPSKIIFGWDISLRAVVNRRTIVVSRWLLKSDHSICKILDKEGGEHGRNIQDGGGMWSNWRDIMGKLYPIPNHIPLGPIIMSSTRDPNKKHIVDCGLETRGVNVVGPMHLT